MTNEEKIQLIGQKIFLLSQNMEKYRNELENLRQQLEQLKTEMYGGKVEDKKITPVIEPQKKEVVVPPVQQPVIPPIQQPVTPPVQQTIVPPVQENIAPQVMQQVIVPPQQQPQQQQFQQQPKKPVAPKKPFQIEEYIGGKLVNIIGIIILVIGVSIGVKYAIDNELINKLGRIVLGFVAGGILMAFAFFTRKKLKLFSAIILSGSISIMYFTSYAGFAFYQLYEAPFAFAIMVVLTAFTVFAAHIYNYEILAIIALVGAYAIPPLLRDDKGNVHIMFTYMTILNLGILFISFKKAWNWVTYIAYGLTWLIFGGWMLAYYSGQEDRYFVTCFSFLNIFFLIFYAMFIAYKVVKKELFSAFDVVRIMTNSGVYFGIGYALLNTKEYEDYLGLFCLGNALIHLVVAALCFKNKNADKKVVFLILTLVFTFITIAVPVQLEGYKVTMVWFTEMAILWVMAKRFNISLYRHMAFALAILGAASLGHDWIMFYYSGKDEASQSEMFANKYFLSTLFGIVSLGVVKFLNHREEKAAALENNPSTGLRTGKSFAPGYSIFFSIALGIIGYLGVVNEIHLKCQNLFEAAGTTTITKYGYPYADYDTSYHSFEAIWILAYTTIYVVGLNILNMLVLKKKELRMIGWILNLVTLFVCTFLGLFLVKDLKDQYYMGVENNTSATAMMHYSRYLLIPFLALLLINLQLFIKQEGLTWSKNVALWISHAVIVLILSNELSFQITERNYEDYDKMLKVSFRTGFTILWGLYSMTIIIWGFARKVKMLRLIGLSLFGITIVNLFVQAFGMTQGYKLITFIVLGIILILVGFLYQKFKHILLEKDRSETIADNKKLEEEKNQQPQ
ncbi:MAG: DUF2339 domain-containing protein [Bacteroidia bacterium]|nr:DUF2339 domain-containing protein [Bacteroidia bacterium]